MHSASLENLSVDSSNIGEQYASNHLFVQQEVSQYATRTLFYPYNTEKCVPVSTCMYPGVTVSLKALHRLLCNQVTTCLVRHHHIF